MASARAFGSPPGPQGLFEDRPSRPRIGGVFRRLAAWLRRKGKGPPEDLDTREELEAREEGRRLLEEKDTYRALSRGGPDTTRGPGGEPPGPFSADGPSRVACVEPDPYG